MILKSDQLAKLLQRRGSADPLVVRPEPDLKKFKDCGAASIELRLGTWFVTMRQSRIPVLELEGAMGDACLQSGISVDNAPKLEEALYGGPASEQRLTKSVYVPFGYRFIIHPGNFVLAASLEWIHLPSNLAGYVVGKSSWGRRGLIIATAAGVHPGFTGCLTLELSNVGEIPIAIRPGLRIGQLFLHTVLTKSRTIDKSSFALQRRPTLGAIEMDEFALSLRGKPAPGPSASPGPVVS